MLKDEYSKSNKEAVLEAIIYEYAERIKKLAYTYVKNWSTAEDITQEVFLSVYNNLDSFRWDCSMKTWLFKITRNKCMDVLQNRWFGVQLIFETVATRFKSNVSTEDTVLLRSEARELSENVLNLPVKYREIIILFYYEEQKITEIHELTGIKIDTIKSRLKRGKERLKQMYGGEFGDG
ncbi:sigma-70 family RNA polymerase sigma factor [Bacillus sp. AK128]